MSLFRQQPNVTLMTRGHCGSVDFLVAWVLIRQHKIACDWLSLAESLKENYKCTTSNKISARFIFIFYCVTETRGTAAFLMRVATCSARATLLRFNRFSQVFKTVSFVSFFFYRNVSKVKRLFIGGAASPDTRWCHKSRKAWKSKTSIWTKRGEAINQGIIAFSPAFKII